MTQVVSLEARFIETGADNVKKGFAEIAKAAALADRQMKVNSQNLKDYARTQIQTNKEMERAAAQQARAAAQQQKQTQAARAADFKSMRNFALGAVAVTAAVVKVGVEAYKTYQDQAGAIRDLSIISGVGAEKTSIFKEVLDDFEISAQDVTIATKTMTKNGLAPTLETVAQLSNEYNKLNTVQEKNNFLIKNFGKGGIDKWALAMEQGGAALMSAGDDVNKWLILNDKQIEQSEQSRLALDAWQDAIKGAKVQLGAFVGGQIVAQEELGTLSEYLEQVGAVSNTKFLAAGTAEAATAEYQRAAEMGAYWAKVLEKQNEAAGSLNFTQEESYQGALQLTQVNQQYAEQTAQLTQLLSEQEKEQARLFAMGYRRKPAEMQGDIDATKQALAALQGNQALTAGQSVSGMLAAKDVDIDKQEKFALATGQITQEALNQQHALEAIADSFSAGKMDATEAAKAVELVTTQLDDLNGKQVDAFINLIVNGNVPNMNVTANHGGAEKNKPILNQGPTQAMASGGQMSGYGLTEVGEHGPEFISGSGWVYTAAQTRAMKSAGIRATRGFALGGSIQSDVDIRQFLGGGLGSKIGTVARGFGRAGDLVNGPGTQAATVKSLVSGVANVTNQNQQTLTNQTEMLTTAQNTTNALLAQLVAKTPTSTGIGNAVAANSQVYK